MSTNKFTKKQSALLNACAADYEAMGDGVMVKAIKGFYADHSHVTARSLEERGWLNVAENSVGEQYASFDGMQYSEWFGLNGGKDDE
ncbi:hypothetical protein [Methylomonas sp. ZR1]|uniref:hypothetical protein n=1 Tax=Methylomonas sp. ZR1 TaxID=1797072 RepID=UPI0014926DAB|nr:hypothetical protein [Methylomonas sp. ZR1]NOV29206.1 hypothetical protein [Methylomonas sp. ZR1]